ncbi:uncharacterized protein LTR77_006387 [Saxophila tyrrhenica]|uniref:Rab-GAP TBC domain-containing protein n=1 Tax=Saxophila tyrrhenica TaxID=1690608 RepID=A0AAV9P886_9PEZI|nr:hypothetical protein LTR77_006387 [Saxophila tyrrhenica]
MADDDDKRSLRARKRPTTAHDNSLKAIRYEDAEDGVPPVPVSSINPPKSPATSTVAASLREQMSARRPRTSPSPSPRVPSTAAFEEVKRDSGIAPSVSTAGRASYAESNNSPSVAGAAKEPNLPTIVVQDEEPAAPVRRSKSPFARPKSRKTMAERRSHSAPRGIARIASFKGIQSNIPSGSLDDIDLEDLASDKVGFSKRGSLLLGGKKMNGLLASQEARRKGAKGIVSQPSAKAREAPVESAIEQTKQVQSERAVSPPVPKVRDNSPEDQESRDGSPASGLLSGRRKPSIQMLHAAIQGGRVLSAEEITFSMKVRSMYDAGDERAAEWVAPVRSGENAQGEASGSSTPDASIDGIVVGKQRKKNQNVHPALRAPSPEPRVSYYKEPNELAGGIEDWEDVEGADVDRYGFIHQARAGTPTSPSMGMQRVATSLRMESDQPRKARGLRRGPSTATRASRSVPPRPSQDNTIRNGSLHSVSSNRSTGKLHSGNPFRSRTRKTLDEAGDMLTLPPGLADIAEQEDSGRTASIMKRREWQRENKWQSMARPIPDHQRSSDKGGGMRFDFDTSDQKLVSRTWKGIPDRWRATAWYSFLATSARNRGITVSEDELIERFFALQDESSADDVQIDVDVPRTINMHIMFRRRYRGGQRLLFRVLHAISLQFPETGYVQGMASLAATLLCYYDEERAFVMLVRLWQLRGLEQLFQHGFEGLMQALAEFEHQWLQGGDVARRLEELGIGSTAYGTRWYLTLFNMSIPFPAQLRVWDVFMLLGDAAGGAPGGGEAKFGGADLDVLHATSAALIDATREIILDSDFENAMKVLTSFVPVKDEDLLMRVARTEWKLRKKRG